MATIATLCYVIKHGKILLIKKKKGLGAGMWNGPGGKVNANEAVKDAASRETMEEIKIAPAELEKIGELEFFFGSDRADWHVHVFRTEEYDGIERETEEAAPKWFKIDKIPYGEMWPDDRLWMPLMIAGKKFHGRFYYDKDAKQLLRHELMEVAEA